MRGVIAAGDPATAAAGAEMLGCGGNAVDAAVAAAFASFVAEVGVVHLGGSGLAQVFVPGKAGKPAASVVYDFFSAMPGLGRNGPRRDLDFSRVSVDFGPTTQEFYLGRGSVAVPGNVVGLCELAADLGRLPLATLLEPAIRLAGEGVTLAPFQAETCALLSPLYTHTAGMRQIFAPSGTIVAPGGRLTVPDLAQTLAELAAEGAEYGRTGRLARALLADQEANGGLLTAEDLRRYEVLRREPIRLPYRGHEVLLPGPSSSGGVLTAFTLSLLGRLDRWPAQYGSADHLQLLCEAMAATSRARPLWERALEEHAAAEAVDRFLDPAVVAGYAAEVAAALAGRGLSPPAVERAPHPETSHLSVVDGDGMAVSLTTTAGESAGYVVPGTGYIPNNILGEADLHPAGFHSRPAGQRIPTMMTPAIVLRDGRTCLVTGSGGSIRIRSAILQVLNNLLDYGRDLAEAVEAARVHLDGGVLQAELGVDPAALDELARRGYTINRWPRRSIYFGGAHSVAQTAGGRLVAAGDSRRGGAIAVAGE